MANANFTCVLDAWRDGTTLYGRMQYYRTDGQTFAYGDSSFPNPTMNLGGTTFTDTAFGNWVRSGINVGNVYTTTFSRTVSGTGSRTVTFTAGSGQRSDFAGTWSAEVGGFPGVTTPPTDLTISAPYGITSTGASFDVSVSSYGTPASASGRYIEAAILETSDYNGNKRAAIASNVNSASIHVDNNSTQVTSLTIRPNTEYYYGAYASNTQTSTMTVSGQFVTPPADPTVSVTNVDGNSATIYYSVGSDGGHYNRILEYSLNGSTWNSAVTISDGNAHTGTFTITNLQAHTSYNVWVRVKTDAGPSPSGFVSFTTKSMFYGAAKHFGNLQLKGNTTQQTYSGKNLLDQSTMVQGNFSYIDNYESANADRIRSPFFPCEPNTTYTLSLSVPIGEIGVIYKDSGGNLIQGFGQTTGDTSYTFTTKAGAYQMRVRVGNATYSKTAGTDYNLQIEKGSTATSYEPYVGGIPAPNPDYPQTVNTVTGRQVVTVADGDSQSQSYEVNLGKNLFDSTTELPSSWSGGTINTISLKLQPNTMYTMSTDLTRNSGLNADMFVYATGGSASTDNNGVWNNRPMSMVTGSDGVVIIAYRAEGRTLNRDDFWYQLEKGNQATTYAPYFTPVELCKIGAYQDYIYKSGDDWYLHKETGTHTTLTSEISLYSDNYSNIRYVVIPKPADSVYYGNYGNGSSIFFTAATWSTETSDWDNASKIGKIFSGASANNFWIGFPKSVTLADAQAKIGGANCCYRIATPTDTKITNQDLVDQLNALYAAQTYGDDTVVTVTSADLGAEFSADYITTKRVEKLYGGVNAIGDLHIAGDTTQQTYSGKNLLNVPSSYTVTGYQSKTVDLKANKTYTIQFDSLTTDGSGNVYFWGNYNGSGYYIDARITSGNKSSTVTLNHDVNTLNIYADTNYASSQGKTTTYTNLMVSESPSVTTYEPYVGGTPAPNPDYPQEVQVVTGEQTVTITDGAEESQEYEVNLGKNLFDVSSITENTSPTFTGGEGHVVTFSANSNRAVMLIKVEPNTSYTLSIGDTSIVNQIFIVGMKNTTTESGHSFSWVTSGTTITTNSKDQYVMGAINTNNGSGGTIANITNANVQLEKGSTATSYAPYISHFGRNINGGYLTNVSRNSGNLTWNNKADGTITVTAGTSSGEYSMLQADATGNRMLTLPAGTYTLSGGNSKIQLSFRVKDGADTTTGPTGKVTFTLNSQTQGFIRALVGNAVTVTAQTLFPQLESGSTSTPYQPFIGGQLELCKIGDYQDYIYKSGNGWYVHKETGTTNVTANGWNGAAHGNRFTFPVPTNALHPLNSTIGDGYGTSIPLGAQGSTWDAVNDSWVLTANDGLFWTHATQNISSTADINNWLASHPFAIYYPLATPTDIQITEQNLIDQLDALHSATTYGDDTVVITASPYVPAQVTAIWISSREILKLYGSVNGQSKLVYKALS